jgi:hypothetical protein
LKILQSMPTYSELEKRRIKEAEKAAKASANAVRAFQATAYAAVTDWVIGSIETEEGRIKYTASNLGKVSTLVRILNRLQRDYQRTMLGSVLNWAGRLFGLNAEYFTTFEPAGKVESIDEAARRLTLQRWGYNVTTKELIPGGYFESLFNNATVGQRVASLVNQAIAQKMPLAQFQKTFRQVFVGLPGQGMLERHWRTNSFDLYQRIDRTANLVYADRLGLDYAIYSGTLEKDSRPWCIKHVNKVLSREEIEKWKDYSWQGKNTIGYDPYTDAGGFSCRHHWSFVSDEIAQHLRPELKQPI